MRSTWPILIGIAFIGVAAFWYDAKNVVATSDAPASTPVVTAEAKLGR